MKKALFPVAFCLLFVALLGGAPRRDPSKAIEPQQASGWQTSGAASAPIEVQDWTTPLPGWLYVLDPFPAPRSTTGRILLLDPTTDKLMGSIKTGSNPDFALSPDGARLYVTARGPGDESRVAAIDTATGQAIEGQPIERRLVPAGIPPYSGMSVSGDGLALRILVNSPTSDGAIDLVTLDTRSGDVLPRLVHLGNCGYGQFIDDSAADEFDFLCPTTNRIRRYKLDEKSRTVDDSFVVIPWERRLGVARAVLAPGGAEMIVARGDGAIFNMDVSTANFAPTPVKGDEQGRVLPATWPISPDGSRLYLGYSHEPNHRFYLDYGRSTTQSPRTQTVEELRVFNTGTWRRLGTIRIRERLWSAVAAPDGKLLYGTSPDTHNVVILDATKLKEIRAIPVGGTPTLVLLAP